MGLTLPVTTPIIALIAIMDITANDAILDRLVIMTIESVKLKCSLDHDLIGMLQGVPP